MLYSIPDKSYSKIRGLYSSFDGEKPPYRKLQFLADFIENWAHFIENSILTIFTDPKPKSLKMFLTANTKAMYLTSNFYIKSVTYVKTTPVAETIVKFYEIAHFLLKTNPFYKNLPLL